LYPERNGLPIKIMPHLKDKGMAPKKDRGGPKNKAVAIKIADMALQIGRCGSKQQ
jgi:hypothetical protein